MKTLRNFLKKMLGNDSGFSIIQGLAVAAALGGVSLALMQQNKISNQQSRTASTSMAVIELQNQIQSYLLQDGACRNTLSAVNLPSDGVGKPILAIKNNSTPGVDVFIQNEIYLNNQVQIQSMTFTRLSNGPGPDDFRGELDVVLNKVGNANNRGSGGAQSRKKYQINAKWDGSGNLIKCHSDLSNAVDGSVRNVIERVCRDAAINGIEYSTLREVCLLTQAGITNNMTTGIDAHLCPANQAVSGIEYSTATRQYKTVCSQIYDMPPTCGAGELLRKITNTQFACVRAGCPANTIYQGLNNGVPICLACGHGQGVVVVNGSMKCVNLSCPGPNAQYFIGLNNQGDPVCSDLVDNSAGTCPGGGKLVVSAGKVKFQCCTATCSDSATVCSGTPYPDPSGCGVCTGTKTASCGDPSTQCQGSYPSSNGCGSCTGTKLPQPGVWGLFSPTSEYRVKAGAVCSCATKLVAQERKYIRGCTQPSCGGAACTGSTEDWLEEGTQSCNPTGCVATGKCTGSGYDSSMFKMAYQTENQNGCQTQYRDVYMDIDTAQFKVGNIYSVTQGNSFTAEVLAGDTPAQVLQRVADKINAANMRGTTLCYGAGNNVVTRATVNGNRMQYHVGWQSSPAMNGTRSCNNLDENTCKSSTGCNWDTTSANLCTGMNYQAKVGRCNGTYYQQGCKWDGSTGNSGNEYECQYQYDDQASCNAQMWSKGCSWGSIAQSCYASTQSDCTAVSGCSWQAYPNEHRSCTGAWESACKGDGAGICTWGPR